MDRERFVCVNTDTAAMKAPSIEALSKKHGGTVHVPTSTRWTTIFLESQLAQRSLNFGPFLLQFWSCTTWISGVANVRG